MFLLCLAFFFFLYPRESFNRNKKVRVSCKLSERNEREDENDKRDEELERALRLDGTISGSSNEFVKQVSSRAYDMRRHLQRSFDSSSYDGKVSLLLLSLIIFQNLVSSVDIFI